MGQKKREMNGWFTSKCRVKLSKRTKWKEIPRVTISSQQATERSKSGERSNALLTVRVRERKEKLVMTTVVYIICFVTITFKIFL